MATSMLLNTKRMEQPKKSTEQNYLHSFFPTDERYLTGDGIHDDPCCSSGRESETALANCHWALSTTTWAATLHSPP